MTSLTNAQTTVATPDLKTLANKHCTVKPRAIDDALLADILRDTLPDWTLPRDENNVVRGLERTYPFEDFYGVMAFVNAITPMIHREDHHPQMQLSFNTCHLQWHTHSLNAVTMNDVICAAKCDVIHDRHG
jgi:4a-hydroxytetrahydrobiopterin dehydratase